MPSKRRIAEDRRRRGAPVIEDHKRLAIGFRPLSVQEELQELACWFDRLILSDSIPPIEASPLPSGRLVLLVF